MARNDSSDRILGNAGKQLMKGANAGGANSLAAQKHKTNSGSVNHLEN